MPADTVISVENLSKKYVIHHSGSRRGDGLRHAIQDAVAAPVRKLRNLGKPSQLNPSEPALRTATEDFYALTDVSFEVRRGEVMGIIGRNGAGKSTLLKILSRITEPSRGRIGIKGRVASLLEVGTGFHPELTGRENIFLNGAILGMQHAEVRRKFEEIVEFAGVEKFLDTPVKHYSSGMYVRLAFAVAAHLEPEILVVDEVLAVGDSEFQQKCLGKMKEVAEGGGRTVLFVSHNMGAISNLCKTAIVLQQGRLVFSGTAPQALSAYTTSTKSNLITNGKHHGVKKARITSLQLLDADGIPASVWDCARGAAFTVGIHISQPLDRLELSIRFESVDGGYAATIFADRSPSGRMPSGVGDYETHLQIGSYSLVPGAYLITAWLHNPMTEMFDLQEKVIAMEITNSNCDFALLGTIPLLGPFLMDPLSLVTTAKENSIRAINGVVMSTGAH